MSAVGICLYPESFSLADCEVRASSYAMLRLPWHGWTQEIDGHKEV